MKKELLFIIDSLECGGAEKSLISLLSVLDYTQYDVHLLIMDPERDPVSGFKIGALEKYLPKDVDILDYRLFGSSLFERIRKFLYYARLSPQHRLNCKRNAAEIQWRSAHCDYKSLEDNYDVAIAYQQGVPTFFLATKVKANKKIAWINADLYHLGFDMDYCRQFYEKMDTVVAVSETLKEKFSEKSPWLRAKLSCIYDIVYQDLIRKMSQEPIDDMLPVDGEFSIVTVGRLSLPKNHLLAVDAARILKDNGIIFKWYFVGEGETRSTIERRIKEYGLDGQVVLLGLKDNPYAYMAKADIYVQTSSHEGFCLTLAEARILHRPIVSTNFDVVHDQIIDRENGLIADIAPESVADKIQELIENESLRNKIIQNLKKENNTTSTTEIQKFYSIIEN